MWYCEISGSGRRTQIRLNQIVLMLMITPYGMVFSRTKAGKASMAEPAKHEAASEKKGGEPMQQDSGAALEMGRQRYLPTGRSLSWTTSSIYLIWCLHANLERITAIPTAPRTSHLTPHARANPPSQLILRALGTPTDCHAPENATRLAAVH